jgi:SAM-dependent methyltransferase
MNADSYEAFMGRWSRPLAEAAIAQLALPPNLRWLDVGCGTGASTQAILAIADPGEVTGVDPSTDFLATAAERVADPRVRFTNGDIASLPFADGQFDVVISALVLHFVSDPLAGVVEMTRVVREGGTVSAYLWNLENDEQFTRYFRRAAMDLDPAASLSNTNVNHTLSNPVPMLALFEEAGLAEVRVEAVVIPTLFGNFDDYWLPCLLDGSSPVQQYARTLTQDRQEALRNHLRSILPIAADGTILLSGHAWMVRGTR